MSVNIKQISDDEEACILDAIVDATLFEEKNINFLSTLYTTTFPDGVTILSPALYDFRLVDFKTGFMSKVT